MGCGSDDDDATHGAGTGGGSSAGRGSGGAQSGKGGTTNAGGSSGSAGAGTTAGRGGASSGAGTGGGAGSGTGGANTGGTNTGGTNTGGASAGTAGKGGTSGSGTAGMNGGESTTNGGEGGGSSGGPTDACSPAVTRGGDYFGFTEELNRYYTDCSWEPTSTVYVSPNGTGDGSSPSSPADVGDTLDEAVPGRLVQFLSGTYDGCFELDSDHSGTYDAPIVLRGERNDDGSLAVTINCCTSGRHTCINLEAADYVAVDGFELVGGDYGIRAVGAGYPADEHQKGVAMLNNVGHGQNKDPFFTGQSDWLVIQHSTAYDTGSGDGHGIYLSNGSDWNIARWNETYDTYSSDFQINADPNSTCADEGVDFDDLECDAVAGSDPTGGRGASDFMLIEANFFHHSQAQGPNFTSVRNSTIVNNVFALPARHGVSFWQETDNPKLGASNNVVAHNLFVTSVDNRQAVQFINDSTDNRFENNVLVAVSIDGGTVSANDGGQLLATDGTTVDANDFAHNAWISGFFGSEDSAPEYTPGSDELRVTTFDAAWFAAFPTTVNHDPADFAPTAAAPWLDLGNLVDEAPTDHDGNARHAPVDLGPYER
jgi:hypothetical protein